MNVNIQGAPIYFEIPILGGIPITATLVVSWGVMLVLTLVCIWLTHDLKVRNISKRQAIAEKIVITAQNFVRNNMGEAWMRYVPFVSTIFAMSIFSSLSSLVGLWPPTADVSTTLAWGIVVFVIITYTKLRTNGLLGYLKGFCDPIFVMAPFNVLGEVFTPISMAFRHFGNVAGGGVITSILYTALGLASTALLNLVSSTIVVPIVVLALGVLLFVLGKKQGKTVRWVFGIVFIVIGVLGLLQYTSILSGVPILQFGIPAVLSVYFDLFSGFVQAFVFSLLSMVYIAGACPPPEEAAQA